MDNLRALESIICSNIRSLRHGRKLSISELASKVGMMPLTLSKIEGGFRSPTAAEIYHIAMALEYDLKDFFVADS